jgi:hypothetical protein
VSHLGRWLSALVDGELDGVERDRVLNHVAGCDACRQEANAMRALKRRLTALGETCAEPPIASRLIELARTDEGSSAGSVRDSASWFAADRRLGTVRMQRDTRAGWKVATGSAGSALIAIALAAFLLGNVSAGPPAPKVTPSVDSYLSQHIHDAGQEPGAAVGDASGYPGSYWSQHTGASVQASVDPGWIGPAYLGQQAAPALAARSGQAASASASPRPLASATASPTASGPSRSGDSRTHAASLRSK